MGKKTVATSISSLLILFLVTIIGASFSAYHVAKNKVELKCVTLHAGAGVTIKDKENNDITKPRIYSSEVGVRPATGEQNNKTNIPSTVNDTIGTEGAYACFYITCEGEYQIILKSATITCGEAENKDNLFVGIFDGDEEAVSFDKVGEIINKGANANNKKVVVVVWIDGDATNSIVSGDIFVELEIIKV